MSPNVSEYERITARILESLDRGVAPWKQPWKGSAPYNVRSGRPYRGINTLLLSLDMRTDPRWGTFRAWKEAGGSVRRGEKGTHIVLWKRAQSKRDIDPDTGEPAYYAFMRSYVVFNALQVDNAPTLELEGEAFEPIAAAEAILEGMPNRPELVIGGSDAFYLPSEDLVALPAREAFEDPEAFYLVAFHELTHSAGASSRCGGLETGTFGSDPYAREELVAEIGAAMLGAACELEARIEASAAYIDGWRAKLSSDPKLIVSAAAESQRRADYIRGNRWNDNGSPTTIERKEANELAAV